ncbi:hypothetical protein MN608_11566 [Microdochium nivale]|nr:hypothetical protein MN608_11566 [Microdochium nivale]
MGLVRAFVELIDGLEQTWVIAGKARRQVEDLLGRPARARRLGSLDDAINRPQYDDTPEKVIS